MRHGARVLAAALLLLAAQPAPGTAQGEPAKEEALQGAWGFVYYEEKGAEQRLAGRQFVISGQTLRFRQDGQERLETALAVDPAKSPKQFDLKFRDGQVYQGIYVLAGDVLLLCGDRSREKRPAEFSCGTEKGGEFLIVLKRRK